MEHLVSTFGDEASSKTTVYRWFQEFKCSCVSLHYQSRNVAEIIDAVHQIIKEDLLIPHFLDLNTFHFTCANGTLLQVISPGSYESESKLKLTVWRLKKKLPTLVVREELLIK